VLTRAIVRPRAVVFRRETESAERAGAVAGAAFTFGAERCDRVVAAVLSRLTGEPA
jgi:hypothetical protein